MADHGWAILACGSKTTGCRFDERMRKENTHMLVTGGAGFIGSFVVDHLLAEGYHVRILDSLCPQVHPHGRPDYLNPAAEFIHGDVRDKETLRSALDHADGVIHCAAAVGVGQSMYQVAHYSDVNVRGTATLLDLLIERKNSPAKLIILSSMTGYGEGVYRRPSDGMLMRVGIRSEDGIRRYGWEPVCPETGEILEGVATPEDAALMADNIYALTKRYQEEMALGLGRFYGFPVVCLRLFNVYGPRQSLCNPYTGVLAIFMSRLLSGSSPLVYEDGRQTRDFVSVHDVVQAIMLAFERDDANGRVINIGSGESRSIEGCARVLARLIGREDLDPEIISKFRKGDIRHCTADIRRAKTLIDYEPRVDWEDGLAELIGWAGSAPFADHLDMAQDELKERGIV
ncbi:MAG: NAD-dependent epimerase/dehydratase family protein [bacterium]